MSFQETQISFTKWIEHQIFLDTQLKPLAGFDYHLTIQSLTSRERYAQKTSRCGTRATYLVFNRVFHKVSDIKYVRL